MGRYKTVQELLCDSEWNLSILFPRLTKKLKKPPKLIRLGSSSPTPVNQQPFVSVMFSNLC